MRRYGSVEEVAAVAVFLLSDDASYGTDTNTEISGSSAWVAARSRQIG